MYLFFSIPDDACYVSKRTFEIKETQIKEQSDAIFHPLV